MSSDASSSRRLFIGIRRRERAAAHSNAGFVGGGGDAAPLSGPGAGCCMVRLRQGELLALTRADLDLDAVPPVIRVRRRVRRDDHGFLDIDTPKSVASRRSVTLPAPLRDALVSHLAQFVGEADDALVFATSRGTVPAPSNLNATLRRALTKAGVGTLRFHDLRHSAQVLAAESGATLAELMARMGHSTPSAAQVYMHARADRDSRLAEALGEAMNGDVDVIPLRRVRN